MITKALTSLGLRLMRRRFRAPTQHWRRRIWDGERAERHPRLGAAYRCEHAGVADLLQAAVSETYFASDIEERSKAVIGIDVGCGTGRYSRELLRVGVAHVVCVDVNPRSLAVLASRIDDPSRVTVIEGDVLETATRESIEQGINRAVSSLLGEVNGARSVRRIVVCCDAIHHLGRPREVLAVLRQLAGPAGMVVGDVWTLDRFHEFQLLRRSRIEAALGATRFVIAATVNAVVKRPLLHAARSVLLPANMIIEEIIEVFGVDRTFATADRYWVRFVTGPGHVSASASTSGRLGGEPSSTYSPAAPSHP